MEKQDIEVYSHNLHSTQKKVSKGEKPAGLIVLWLHKEADANIGVPTVTSRYIIKGTPHEDTCLICSGGKVNKISSRNERNTSRMT